MDYVVSMFVNRPYVVTLVLTFMVVAAAERGWLRMVIWLMPPEKQIGLVLANTAVFVAAFIVFNFLFVRRKLRLPSSRQAQPNTRGRES